jgi:hypothetical protein
MLKYLRISVTALSLTRYFLGPCFVERILPLDRLMDVLEVPLYQRENHRDVSDRLADLDRPGQLRYYPR